MLKEYQAVIYEDDIKSTHTIWANSKEDALRIAWELYDADDIYVVEVKD